MPGRLISTPQRSQSGSDTSNVGSGPPHPDTAAINGVSFRDSLRNARTNGTTVNRQASNLNGFRTTIHRHSNMHSTSSEESLVNYSGSEQMLEEVDEAAISGLTVTFTPDARQAARAHTLHHGVTTAALHSRPDDQVFVYRFQEGVVMEEVMPEADFLALQRSRPIFRQFSQQSSEDVGADSEMAEAGTSDGQSASWTEDADSRQGNDSLSPPVEESASG